MPWRAKELHLQRAVPIDALLYMWLTIIFRTARGAPQNEFIYIAISESLAGFDTELITRGY